MIGRIGNVEGSSLLDKPNKQLWTNAGLYGDYNSYLDWKKLYIESIKECDVLSYVYTCPSFYISVGDTLTSLGIYKPMIPYFEWAEYYLKFFEILSKKNKKIGIISSFYRDIIEQVKKITLIYPDFPDINPDLFVVVESYNTNNNNVPEGHTGFNYTLQDLATRVLEHDDVDFWFVSCGCYGMPLQAILKNANKNSMYVGGLIQILFGIMGKRWENRPEVMNHLSIHWKTAEYLDVKTMGNLAKIENGCYL
tara:strand:+ start:1600 stop:2352 length:753 start_codon:yes stop_codon:yes gene_type:complete